MCDCVNVDLGTYANQVALPRPAHFGPVDPGCPKHSFGIDRCLVAEIQHLWSQGIITTGCCCGHSKQDGFLGVEDQFIETMIGMGYEVAHNRSRPGDRDSFSPKTPGCRPGPQTNGDAECA